MGRVKIVMLMAAMAVVLTCGNLQAQLLKEEEEGKYTYGPWIIHPSLAVETRYNDNIDETKDGGRNDSIIDIQPGIKIVRRDERFPFNFGYLGHFNDYDKYPAEEYDQHDAYMSLRIVGERSDWILSDTFSRISATASVVTDRIKAKENVFTLGYDYKFQTLGPLSDAGILLEVDRGDTEGDVDLYYNEFRLGIHGKPTETIELTAKAGYQNRKYDNVLYRDYEGATGLLSLANQFSEISSLGLLLSSSIENDTYENSGYKHLHSLAATYTHKLHELIKLDLGAHIDKEEYARADRDDDVIGGSIGLTYNLSRYVGIYLKHEYYTRDSDVSTRDADVNISSMGAKVIF